MEKNPAGFWIRLGANLIDGIIFAILGYFLVLLIGEGIGSNANSGIQFLYGLLLPIFWYGYTVGKRAVSIRIVRVNGSNVTFWTMLKRTLLSGILYSAPIGIGVIIALTMAWTELAQALASPMDANLEMSNSMMSAFAIFFGGMLLTLILLAASAIMVGVREDKRSLHDLIAGTYVTRNSPGEPVGTGVNVIKEA
ncbi:RDD family protein [Metabacillus sp. KIGAM252]|uniref:RDD family protein n=1 Tax=Metabacillus flavus TaxID=2823519 RepID=A0ABS5LB41_9BACI|nr:RDD family protein [Metabacillus flavus]MBS2967942.1 RDD family protein [Metabacillus flavus]